MTSQQRVTAAVMIIGDEILSGRTQDTNLSAIAKYIGTYGVDLAEARVVPDVPRERCLQHFEGASAAAAKRTRGIHDADAPFGDDALDHEAADHLPDQHRSRRGFTRSNRKQRSGITGLFHQPSNRKAFKSTKETLEEIDDQRTKEASARKFFLPLEQEFFLSRLLIELEERKYLH